MENATNATAQEDGTISLGQKYFCVFMFSIFCVVGICGNTLAVIVYSRKKDKLTSTIFILALAIIDLFSCAVLIPMTLYMEFVDFMIASDALCKVYNFISTSSIPFSAFMMAAIAVDRYFCICHPFLHAVTAFRAKVIIVVLGLLAFALGLVAGLMFGTYGQVPYNVTLFEEGNGTMYREGYVTLYNITDDKECKLNFIYFSVEIVNGYKYAHLSTYFMSVVVVSVLYFLIYRRVITRRMMRMQQRSQGPRTDITITVNNEQSSVNDAVEMSTKVAPSLNGSSGKSDSNGNGFDVENNLKEKHKDAEQNGESPDSSLLNTSRPNGDGSRTPLSSPRKDSSNKFTSIFRRTGSKSSARERLMLANLKTAGMLFVVSLVFIVTFLPGMLVILEVLSFQPAYFYLYFINSVANPVIYAFMNRNFRDDLKQLLLCQQKGRIVRYR